MSGVLHYCKVLKRNTFYDPLIFPNCQTCGEDLTTKQIIEVDACETIRAKIIDSKPKSAYSQSFMN